MDWNEWNKQIIEEFRANGGRCGGPFEGSPMVILHTKGAKTGKERLNPLMAYLEGDDIYIFASKGGAPDNPDWYHNLVADPDVTIEYLGETVPVRAEVVDRAERDRIYAAQAEAWPQFAGYEEATSRVIPVIRLRRV